MKEEFVKVLMGCLFVGWGNIPILHLAWSRWMTQFLYQLLRLSLVEVYRPGFYWNVFKSPSPCLIKSPCPCLLRYAELYAVNLEMCWSFQCVWWVSNFSNFRCRDFVHLCSFEVWRVIFWMDGKLTCETIDPCHVSSVTNIDLRARLERDVKFGRQLSKRDAGGLGGRMWSELNEIKIKRGRMPSNLAISGLRWPKPSANPNPPLSHH